MKIWSKQKFTFLRIGISFAFLCLLFWLMKDKLPQVFNALRSTNIWFFFLGLILFVSEIVMIASRLKLVLNVQDIFFPLKDLTYLTFIGLFFNNFFPTSIGGDVVKAYYTSKRTDNKLISIYSIFLDRVFGLFTFIVIALLVLIFIEKSPKYTQLVWLLSIILFIALTVIVFLSNFKLMRFLSNISTKFKKYNIKDGLIKIHHCFIAYFKERSTLLSIIGISLLAQITGMVSIYFLAQGLGLEISLFILFLTLPIIFAVSMLPSINGLGIRESAFVFCLKDIIGPEGSLALSLLFLAMLLSTSLIGGILFLFNKGYGKIPVISNQ